jgi:hypothetical protein
VMTPEYKVVAVRVDKQCVTARPPGRWPFAGRNPRLSPDGS